MLVLLLVGPVRSNLPVYHPHMLPHLINPVKRTTSKHHATLTQRDIAPVLRLHDRMLDFVVSSELCETAVRSMAVRVLTLDVAV
jgi:hypothetical protein